ncbi:hypothetical protein D3C75_1275740 [compost metagenome]
MWIDNATNTTMKTNWTTTSNRLTRVMDSMPIRLRKVTRAMEPSTHTAAGTAGKYSDM